MTTLSARPVPAAWPSVPRELPRTMSAVVFDAFGPPDVLRVDTVDVPEVGPRRGPGGVARCLRGGSSTSPCGQAGTPSNRSCPTFSGWSTRARWSRSVPT